MIDPTGKRQMSAMEELQAIARASWHRAVVHAYVVPDWEAWEREMLTDVPQDAIRYMEGER